MSIQFNYKHALTNSATAVVLSRDVGARLGRVTINSKGAASNLLTIHDSNSTTVSSSTAIAIIDTTIQPGTFIYDVVCANGIAYVLNTGTAADVTISWA